MHVVRLPRLSSNEAFLPRVQTLNTIVYLFFPDPRHYLDTLLTRKIEIKQENKKIILKRGKFRGKKKPSVRVRQYC
jgi:hypothetical protein